MFLNGAPSSNDLRTTIRRNKSMNNDENAFVPSRKGLSSRRGVLKPAALGNHNQNGSSSLSSSLGNGGNLQKTPKASSTRRALGDISNRKADRGGGNHGGGGAVKPGRAKSVAFSTPGRSAKKKKSAAAPLSSSRAPGSALRSKASGAAPALTPRRPSGPSKSSLLLPQSSARKRGGAVLSGPVEFPIPQKQRTVTFFEGNFPDGKDEVAVDPVEDVEMPAGRRWAEEQELLSDDETQISVELDPECIDLAGIAQDVYDRERREREAAFAKEEALANQAFQRKTDAFDNREDDDMDVLMDKMGDLLDTLDLEDDNDDDSFLLATLCDNDNGGADERSRRAQRRRRQKEEDISL